MEFLSTFLSIIGAVLTILIGYYSYKNISQDIKKKKIEKEIEEKKLYEKTLQNLREVLEETTNECRKELEMLKTNYQKDIDNLKILHLEKSNENERLKLEITYLKLTLEKIISAIDVAIRYIEEEDDRNVLQEIRNIFNKK